MPYNRFARRKNAPTAPQGDDSVEAVSRSKFNNKKVVHIDGTFDSKAELARWIDLKDQQASGVITDLKRQQWIELIPALVRWDGKKIPKMRMRVDFTFHVQGRFTIEDYKGFATPDFLIKYKIFLLRYPGVEFRLFRHGKPYDPYGPKRKRTKKELLDR